VKALVASGILCLGSSFFCDQTTARGSAAVFELYLQTDRPAYVQGQPVYLRLFVRNRSDDNQYLSPALLILDGQGRPLGPPQGNKNDTENGAGRYDEVAPSPTLAPFFGFMAPLGDLQYWFYTLNEPGSYTLELLGQRGASRSNPVRIAVLRKSDAQRRPPRMLDDPKLDGKLDGLLAQYHAVLVRTADLIGKVPRTPRVGNVYYSFGPAWGQNGPYAFEDRVMQLHGAGDPSSPYVNVIANLMQSLRHLKRVTDVVIWPPPGAFDETPQPLNAWTTAPPRTLAPATCDVAQAAGELKEAQYFYNAVKSEIARGYASLGDAIDPPSVSSAPRKCPW
jgi:hypothetical protein